MRIRESWRFRDSIEVEEKYTGRYGAPGEKREKRRKPTPEQMARQNQWRRERDLRRLIKANYSEHDYWVTLTYRKDARPPSMAAAKKELRKILRNLKERYRRRGSPLKYIAVVEIGSRGKIHFHILINRIEGADKMLGELWRKGTVHLVLTYQQGGFRELADYIAKPAKVKAEKWFTRSRNMTVPKPKRETMKGKTWRKEPKPPKGFYLEKETLVEGTNPVTGRQYRYYTFVRGKEKCGG